MSNTWRLQYFSKTEKRKKSKERDRTKEKMHIL